MNSQSGLISRIRNRVRWRLRLAKAKHESRDLPAWLPEPKSLEERELELYQELTRDLESQLGVEEGEFQEVVDRRFDDEE